MAWPQEFRWLHTMWHSSRCGRTPCVGQHGHDVRRRHSREARLVGHRQQLRTLGRAEGMAGVGRTAFGLPSPAVRPHGPSNAAGCARQCLRSRGEAQSRSCGVCHDDVLGHDAAISEVDHLSPPLSRCSHRLKPRRCSPDWASLRHRSSVAVLTPTSRATTSAAALSGGNNLATAVSLNACPYRATSVLHRRPLGFWFYRGDNYSDAGGCPPVQPSGRPGTVPPQDRTRPREGQCSPGAS